ncbi:hypothetical protein [Bacillus cereus]|uniref:Uncharacterized protein n=1 Tax=Bacillus cereus TaxID=1396 RepID=A0A9X8IW82_BACCE|nr:hypothetical protein [Bacillus cereus]RWQ71097.1 hypothetical protein DR116_0024890 [Bacillus cereus]
MGYIISLLVSTIIAFILGVFFSEEVTKKINSFRFSWGKITSILVIYSTLTVMVIYALGYLPRKSYFLGTWLTKCGMSFYDLTLYIINHHQTYVELAAWIGLYHVLNANRKSMKQKLKISKWYGAKSFSLII